MLHQFTNGSRVSGFLQEIAPHINRVRVFLVTLFVPARDCSPALCQGTRPDVLYFAARAPGGRKSCSLSLQPGVRMFVDLLGHIQKMDLTMPSTSIDELCRCRGAR